MIDVDKLLKKVQALEKKHKAEVDGIISKEVFDNAKYKVGDIISNSYVTIEIIKVRWSKGDFFAHKFNPQAVYYGYTLTKKLARRKDQDVSSIYASDIGSSF